MNSETIERIATAMTQQAETPGELLFAMNIMAAVIAERNGDSRAYAIHVREFFKSRVADLENDIKISEN